MKPFKKQHQKKEFIFQPIQDGLKVLFLILICVVPMSSQVSSDWKNYLNDKLEADSDIRYLHLVGYFNDAVYMDMYLAYDTSDWVGIIAFPDAEIEYNLEGLETSDRIFLNEYDQGGRETGYWTLEKKHNQYFGIWRNIDQAMSYEAVLYDEFWNPGFKKAYHKNISNYEGRIGNKSFQFSITRDHSGPINMSWFDLQNKRETLADWKCSDVFCREFTITNETFPIDKKAGEIGAMLNGNQLTWSYSDGNNVEQTATLDLKSERITRIKAHSEWSHFVIAEYPVMEDQLASIAFEYWTNKILDSLSVQLLSIPETEIDTTGRWNYFAHTWLEVYYWDDQLFSGKWVIQRSWTGDKWTLPVNYSIKDDEIINISKQFKSDFDFDFYLTHFIKNEILNLPEYRDLLIRNKLNESAFEHLNFSKEGLVIGTDFDTFFGSFHMVVPYKDIYPELRKRSPLKKLIDKELDD